MRKLIALTTITLLLLSSCAKMGQPDGGWYDETPPAVIGAIPQERSTLYQFTWMKLLDCTPNEDNSYTYQLNVNPTDNPECFENVA